MAESPEFDKFSFQELIEMVQAISRTKHRSREGVWREGYGLQSIEHLEAHIDDILEEMAKRMRSAFSLARIQSNFRHNELNLPHDLLNLNNINATQLNSILFRNSNLIGAERNDQNEEEIFIIINDVKYKMQTDGRIVV